MTLRIGVDMDGVLADLGTVYREIETRLFGPSVAAEECSHRAGDNRDAGSRIWPPRQPGVSGNRRADAVWTAIKAIPDFWLTLKPIEPGAVRRLHTLRLEHGWEVFFITERPATVGDSVQRQTQRWLSEQGFDMPSVVTVSESRCAASKGLALHFYLDDCANHCVDLKAESRTRPILIVDDESGTTAKHARRLGIGTACYASAAFDVFVKATAPASTAFQQVAQLVGWK